MAVVLQQLHDTLDHMLLPELVGLMNQFRCDDGCGPKRLLRQFPVASQPLPHLFGMIARPNSSHIYYADMNNHEVRMVDTATGTCLHTVGRDVL